MIKDVVTLSEKTEEMMIMFKERGYQVPSLDIIKSPREIDAIKASAKINTALLDYLSDYIKEGVTTLEIDDLAMQFYQDNDAVAAPLNYNGYPKHICTSINEVVCHGIPENRILKSGDILNVDVSTIYKGYFSDASRMYAIGDISVNDQKLIDVTKLCLAEAIAILKPYITVNDIGNVIDKCAKKHGFSVVRELGGHGIGLKFHEDPFIYHYKKFKKEMLLVPGMTFTIEPMINAGKRHVYLDTKDMWTIYTKDHKKSAQVEHMVLITADGYEILTS